MRRDGRGPLRARSAGALVYRRGSGGPLFLLLNYPQGHWDFVKGHVEGEETDVQAAVREAREETGITDLEFDPGFKKTVRYRFYAPGGRPVEKSVVFFLARTRTSRVVLSEEHRAYCWEPMPAARKKATFENARRLLDSARGYMLRSDAAERGSSARSRERPTMR